MKLFIPTIGTQLRLTKKWEFKLFFEYRNESVMSHFDIDRENRRYSKTDQFKVVSFPKNTMLIVDRIYIRAGGSDIKKYDSVTFRVILPDGTQNAPVSTWGGKIRNLRLRFWAKLEDVNNIYCLHIVNK